VDVTLQWCGVHRCHGRDRPRVWHQRNQSFLRAANPSPCHRTALSLPVVIRCDLCGEKANLVPQCLSLSPSCWRPAPFCKAGLWSSGVNLVRAGPWRSSPATTRKLSCACAPGPRRGAHGGALSRRERVGLRLSRPSATLRAPGSSRYCLGQAKPRPRDAEAKPLPKAEEAWGAHRVSLLAGGRWAATAALRGARRRQRNAT